ncbi:bidirectional hydrogenase complex protein HoxE [Egbenema bharatensis]|uniref:bidirectional hydrogenase complex protein HoxE n=1 Tax=Egbenema bharatensis TaxID=3463334 RepID=UPI003A89515D
MHPIVNHRPNHLRNAPPYSRGDQRFRLLEATLKRHQYQQDALIEILHTAQALFGYLKDDVLLYIAHQLKLPLSHVYGVATFYHFFTLHPQGVHTCVVCMGTACYVKGAAALLETVEQQVNIHPEQTTADGQLTLQTARCLGACGIAPAIVLDDVVEGYQTVEGVRRKVEEWLGEVGRRE